MNILKNKVFLLIIAVVVVFSAVYFGNFLTSDVVPTTTPSTDSTSSPQASPSTSPSAMSSGPNGSGPTASPSATPPPAGGPVLTKTPSLTRTSAPLPTGDGRTTFIDEPVPWGLLLKDASCKLQGEIKFLDHNTYNNQDAKFVYSGIDNSARNIFWTVTPDDDISVGPNMFAKRVIPDGDSLLGIVLPENPKSKTYTLTAKIQYGRLVDEKGNFVAAGGNVKIFEKQCEGKTTIVLP